MHVRGKVGGTTVTTPLVKYIAAVTPHPIAGSASAGLVCTSSRYAKEIITQEERMID
jgi:hypothetical protein